MPQQRETGTYLEKRLPVRLMKEVCHLAEKYEKKGARLFVFGSFARGDDRDYSDLDLGVLWTGERSAKTFSGLYWDVQTG